ncbi:MAG: HPr family phosphocarrier protein [Fusobacteriaceae bacterium]|jgi:phosphocarrier protein|nr:HPr family phosphocarrier protein [Fusobacteriaceae bacterium]
MKMRKVTIMNKAGMHARPSSLFVQLITKYDSEIKVKYKDEEVNGRSIMGLMLLAAEQGRELELIAEGSDEDAMLDALVDLIEVKKFNEE